MTKSFSQQIGKWAAATPQRIKATRDRAVGLLGDEMTKTVNDGGLVPFKDGHLARSLVASNVAMPSVSNDIPSGFTLGTTAIRTPLDAPIWLGYTMIYARRMNYGFVGQDALGRSYNQQGNYFVEGAIKQWPQLVEKAAKEIQSEAGQ